MANPQLAKEQTNVVQTPHRDHATLPKASLNAGTGLGGVFEESKAALLSKKVGAPNGVYIKSVDKGGPLDLAGVQAGDRIIGFDSGKISSLSGFINAIHKHVEGCKVAFRIVRDDNYEKPVTKIVKIGEGRGYLGIKLEDGLTIKEPELGAPCYRKLKEGDKILGIDTVNGVKTDICTGYSDPSAFDTALNSLKATDSVKLKIFRPGIAGAAGEIMFATIGADPYPAHGLARSANIHGEVKF